MGITASPRAGLRCNGCSQAAQAEQPPNSVVEVEQGGVKAALCTRCALFLLGETRLAQVLASGLAGGPELLASQRSHRHPPSIRQGEHGAGPRKYTPADVAAVRRALTGTTTTTTRTIAEIATHAALNGRTVRSIISERDGIDFLVGVGAGGALFLARTPAEAGGMTGKMRSQVVQMAERIRRRDVYADSMHLQEQRSA